MVCDDDDEAQEIGREISKVNTGCLRTYWDLFDLIETPPQGRIAAVILATRSDPETMRQTLQWMRHRWPRCPVTVVGDVGGEEHELAARENGANFLTRPVTSAQWRAIVDHATGRDQFFVEGGSSPARARPLKQWPERRQATRASGACGGST
jgi:DNA-binding response OmpR family regulator